MKPLASLAAARAAGLVVQLVLGFSLAVWSASALALCSGATLSMPGEMPVFKRGLNGSRSYSMGPFETSQWGMMTQSSLSTPPGPMTFSVTTPFGNGNYSFEFSPNVTKIRILLKGELLYAGAPITVLDASKKERGELRVEFEWTGKDVTLTVADACPGPRAR